MNMKNNLNKKKKNKVTLSLMEIFSMLNTQKIEYAIIILI